MTNIIIIDDELHCANVLDNLIKKTHSEYTVTGIFTNPSLGLEHLQI